MSDFTVTLSDLVQISRDGHAFYSEAAGKVIDAEARQTIDDMAAVRANLIRDLSRQLKEHGEEPPRRGTLYGAMAKLYADTLATFSGDRDGVYVSQLEEAEDRLLHTFEEALLSVDEPETRAILKRYLPLARNAHARMSDLKHRKGN
ncbi:MAG: PA2169 family four-helix-bundle protein [Dokdonella sp.]